MQYNLDLYIVILFSILTNRYCEIFLFMLKYHLGVIYDE